MGTTPGVVAAGGHLEEVFGVGHIVSKRAGDEFEKVSTGIAQSTECTVRRPHGQRVVAVAHDVVVVARLASHDLRAGVCGVLGPLRREWSAPITPAAAAAARHGPVLEREVTLPTDGECHTFRAWIDGVARKVFAGATQHGLCSLDAGGRVDVIDVECVPRLPAIAATARPELFEVDKEGGGPRRPGRRWWCK